MKTCHNCGNEHNNKWKYCKKEVVNNCLLCNAEIETICDNRMKKLCDVKCTAAYASKKSAQKKGDPKDCQMCGKQFFLKKVPRDGVLGCSPRCRFQIRTGPRKCAHCEKNFIPKSDTSKVCSLSCSGKISQSGKSKEKRLKTNVERYGAENPFASEKIKEKIKETNIERHGVENPSQSKKIRKKTESTNFERYGVKAPLQNKSVLEKLQKTNLERYDNKCSLYNEEVRQKTYATNIERYGAKTPFESEIIQEKIGTTNLERYGSKNPFSSEEIKKKIKEINVEKYGVENYSNSKEAEQIYKSRIETIIKLFKDGFSEHEIATKVGCQYVTVRRVLLNNNLVEKSNISQINKKWQHLIKTALGIDFEFEGAIFTNKRLKVDLFNENLKLAIDINPTITHSTQLTPYSERVSKKVKNTNYHKERAVDAEENGWELIQIFDWDNEEDILELIRARLYNDIVYARKCEVRELSRNESYEFLNVNHRESLKENSSVHYGLFFENELLQVMNFSEISESFYEILQFSSKVGISVIGGASKLMKTFINSDYNPNKIIGYSDFSKNSGKSYTKMNMKFLGFTDVNLHYSSISGKESFKIEDLDSTPSLQYEMNNKGFYEVADAGNKVFIWER